MSKTKENKIEEVIETIWKKMSQYTWWHYRWRKKLREQILMEIDKEICQLQKEFTNTPLDKRGTGWDWLKKVKEKIK